MVLAKFKVGKETEIAYITIAEFKKLCTVERGGIPVIVQEEGHHWASIGRLGSRWQIGSTMFIKVEKNGDGIEAYYTPPEKSVSVSTPWAGECGGNCCSGSGCTTSGCKSGCGGKCP